MSDPNNQPRFGEKPLTEAKARAGFEAMQRRGNPSEGQDCSWIFASLPKVLPGHWTEVIRLEDGAKYLRASPPLLVKPIVFSVIISGCRELDNKRWLHVSCAYADRLPTWKDLGEVKDLFIGKDKLALQVLPKESDYININPYVLHLWHCLDGDPTPDFTHGGQGL